MAITFCRSLGQFMRFGQQPCFVVARNVICRKSVHSSCSALTERRGILVCPSTLPFMRQLSTAEPSPQKETVTIHFKFPDGSRKTAKATVGENLLDAVLSNNLDIDGYGACEGTLACSTCHLVFSQQNYSKLPQKPTDEELDMLDLAYGLSDTSRLGCQVIVTKDMNDWEVNVPGGTADARG